MTKKNLLFSIFMLMFILPLGMKTWPQTAAEGLQSFSIKTNTIFPIPFGVPSGEAFTLAASGQNNSEAAHINFSGYTQLRFRSRPDGSDGFDIRRSRLTLRGRIAGPFDYKLQGEFGGSSGFKLLDAAISFRIHPAVDLTVGQQKIPFSLESSASSTRLDTINRSQPVEALAARSRDVLGNQSGRDIGATVHGSLGNGPDTMRFEYAVGVFNGAGINSSDDNDSKDLAGRVRAILFPGLSAGASFYSGRRTPIGDPEKSFDRSRWGLELSWKYGIFDLKGEYLHGRDEPVNRNGWYAQLGAFAVKDKLRVVAKIDSFDPNTATDGNRRDIATLGVNWFISGAARLQVNYEIRSEEGDAVDNNLFIAQFQIRY